MEEKDDKNGSKELLDNSTKGFGHHILKMEDWCVILITCLPHLTHTDVFLLDVSGKERWNIQWSLRWSLLCWIFDHCKCVWVGFLHKYEFLKQSTIQELLVW